MNTNTTFLLTAYAEATQASYWPPEFTWRDRLREWAAHRAMGFSGLMWRLANQCEAWPVLWQLFDFLNQWGEDLFSLWCSETEFEFNLTLNSEMPLQYASSWILKHFPAETIWRCSRCQQGFTLDQTIEGKCPNGCAEDDYHVGHLYLD